ncbi:QWRF motif-containing protein 2 [Andrographis paniculata]|uniref:QWRF motif-containing protein 2 n=1 Tax=Andrographis paniculata TaxID=175694 RepID=UPI0021E7635A|nr:QWRF motif-containing protein 2 [Andrographis paniculata]
MVAAAAAPSTAPADSQNPKTSNPRPPLLPSEKDNNYNSPANLKKPKSKIVSSRYMAAARSPSSSSSRRFPFTAPSNPASAALNRSVSVDRSRPRHPQPGPDPKPDSSAATKLLVASTRSLSVSFQGGAFPLPFSKSKPVPAKNTATPPRRKIDHTENSKPDHQHRWPARSRSANALSTSVNGSPNGIHSFRRSMIAGNQRPSLDLGDSELPKDRNSVHNYASGLYDLTASDSDSASSGSTTGVQESRRLSSSPGQNRPNGIIVSARFWQETNRRLRRLQDPGSPLLSTSPASKLIVPPKLISSPRPYIRPASPSKGIMPPGSSPAARSNSPSRNRNSGSTLSTSFSDSPIAGRCSVDAPRRKAGENKIVDAHVLRLLYNRQMQWRLVNARTEALRLVQKRRAEKNLWNAWITISNLRDCLTKKRHRLQLLRQKLKLAAILKGEISFLEDWASLDEQHSISLIGAIESLKASTLRLPVIGAIANVQSLQDAIGSAVDVMQATASSIHLLLPQVEEVNESAHELAKVTAEERAWLEQCTDVISLLAALQVNGISLRTHMLQSDRSSLRPLRRPDVLSKRSMF